MPTEEFFVPKDGTEELKYTASNNATYNHQWVLVVLAYSQLRDANKRELVGLPVPWICKWCVGEVLTPVIIVDFPSGEAVHGWDEHVFHDPNLAIEQQYIQHRDFAKEPSQCKVLFCGMHCSCAVRDAASVLSLVATELKAFHCTTGTNPKWVYNVNIAAALRAAGAWQSHRLGLELQHNCEAEE